MSHLNPAREVEWREPLGRQVEGDRQQRERARLLVDRRVEARDEALRAPSRGRRG